MNLLPCHSKFSLISKTYIFSYFTESNTVSHSRIQEFANNLNSHIIRKQIIREIKIRQIFPNLQYDTKTGITDSRFQTRSDTNQPVQLHSQYYN